MLVDIVHAIISKSGRYWLYPIILIILWLAISKIAKLPDFANKIIDDITVIGLSVQMLEIRCKPTLNDETKTYFQQIRARCDIIVKNIYDNADKFPSKN
ncbi:MAG: hypothetical protein HC944_02520 [Nanoarchaeota archaeon]|nr:hypothetical protein [Nanoarchaeota archaeon]